MDKKKNTTKKVKRDIKSFVDYLKKDHNLNIKKVYLFGSYAKDKQHKWSDIDIAIVSPFFDKEDALSYLWRLRRKEDIDNMIAPIGLSVKDIKSKKSSPLIWEIKKTGKEIKI